MKKKEQLLQLFKDKNWKEIPDFLSINGRSRTKSHSELHEALGELSRNDQDFIWMSITHLLAEHIRRNFEAVESPSSDETLDEEEKIALFDSLLNLGILQVQALVDGKRPVSAPSQRFVQFIVVVGGLLSDFNEPVHESATALCESWINNELERASEILPDTLLAVIEICLKPTSKKVDVKRAWNLRAGCDELSLRIEDPESESANAVCELLLGCMKSPLFLSCEEGVKFLSCLMGISYLVPAFHSIVKNSIPTASKSHCEKYAQIYFRAWKQSEGELKKKLEETCLQDLMYLAVHADPSHQLSSNLHCFLRYIHTHKKHLPTASLIYSLYEPFLWRSLKVANGYVRTNAAIILCDLFPCTDVNLSIEEKDDLMAKQYQSFLTLLNDPCHLVRIATVKGTFSILKDFWLLIPSHTIQRMFQIFLKRLIVDGSSPEIRKLVVQGMTKLLDCRNAGPFMTSILPTVSGAFDDMSSSVRVAFIKLLLKVKATRFIKYWKLVSMERLIDRLAIDVSDVRTLITQLIHSSFLSPHLEEKEIVTRCISLIELNRNGARRFYQHASKTLDLEAATKLILFIWRTLQRYILRSRTIQNSFNAEDGSESSACFSTSPSQDPVKKQKKMSMKQSKNKENEAPLMSCGADNSNKSSTGSKDENEEASEMPLDNPNIVGGLLDTIVIVWTMKASRLSLPENLKYLDALRTRISRSFPIIWGFFKETDDIAKDLLYLSSFLPRVQIPTMVGLSLSRLNDVKEDEDANIYATYVNALCNWNRVDDIMELILEWIDAAFSSALQSSGESRQLKVKRVYFKEKGQPKPRVALSFLNHILVHPLNKVCLLESNRNLLLQLFHKMATIQKLLERRFVEGEGPLSPLCSDQFLLDCWGDFLCVVLLLNHHPAEEEEKDSSNRRTRSADSSLSSLNQVERFDSLSLFKEYTQWMSMLLPDMDQDPSFNSFYYSCSANFFKAGLNLIAIGLADEDFLNKYLDFLTQLFQKAPLDLDIWCLGFRTISQAQSHFNAYSKSNTHCIPSSSPTLHAFSLILTSLKEKWNNLCCDDHNKLVEFSKSLSLTIITLGEDSNILSSISKIFVKLVLESVLAHLQSNENEEICRVKDLWKEAFVLLSSVHMTAKLIHSFINALVEEIANIETVEFMWAGSWLLLLLWADPGRASRHNMRCSVEKVLVIQERIQAPLTPTEEELEVTSVKRNFEMKTEELLEKLKSSL